MQYFCIGDPDMITGLRLAGVTGVVAHTAHEAREAFHDATRMLDVGVVLVSEPLAAMIRDDIDKFQCTAHVPLILEIPTRDGALPGRKNLAQIVRQAVGVQV